MLLLMIIVGAGGVKAEETTETLDFSFNSMGSDGWTNTYEKHVVDFENAIVTFSSADKNNSTIKDHPVTKGQPVTLVLKDSNKQLKKTTFTCRQWDSKTQTITLYYSTDGGKNYTSTGITSTNFVITSDALPSGTNAVKITFSNTNNQVGIASAEITFSDNTSTSVTTTTTIDASGITNTDVCQGVAAGSLSATVKDASGNAVNGATVAWESSNPGVATIDGNGDVTLVAAGTTTITATYAGNNDYQTSSATYELTVIDSTPFEDVIFKAAEDKDESTTSIAGSGFIVKDNVKFSCTSGILGNGSEYRMYKNSTVTISTTDGSLITKIEFTGVSGNPASGFGEQTGWSTSGNNGIWTGKAESVSFKASGAQVRATEIKVTVAENTNPSIIANNVEILYDAKSGSISYSIEKPVDGGMLTASTENTWLTLGDVTADAVLFTALENEAFTTRTASVILTYTYGNNKTVTKEVTITQAGNPNAPGTQNNPYTVDQAIENTPATGNTDEVYVKGIVSKVDNYDSSHHSITYWISADGTTDGNQVEVYSGKGIDGANFSSINDIQVGDIVVVKGTLKKYNDITEFNYNNQLVSLDRPVKPKHWAKFFVDGEELVEDAVEIQEGQNITFPEATSEINGKIFMGWLAEEITGTTDEAPTYVNVNAATMGKDNVTFYAVYAKVIGEGSSTTIEVTNEAIKNYASGHNSYSSYSNDKDLEGWTGRYAINNNSGTYSLQLGYNTDSGKNAYNSHLTTPNCDSNITSITINTQNNTASGRTFYLCNATDLGCATSEDAIYGQGSITAQNGSVTIPVTGNANQVHIYPNGTAYIASISLTYGTPATYSDYCTTVVAPVKPAKPIVFHDGGKYEGTLTVAMAGEGTIKYTLNGDEQTYTAPFTINETTTIKAWTEQDGAKSDEVEKTFTIVEKAKGAVVEDGYYTIQTNDDDGKYVNVAGRKTVTLVSDTKSAGTVIRVKADEDGVKVLRSQAVDLPRYAERAMSYVPEIVKEVVKKLAANVDDPIIGEQGADLILDKFNKEFDYHLYLEGENNTYRIYGRTPSMKPVVDFYAENKELIDGRLLKVEGFVKEVLQKVVDKVGRGQSVVDMFKVKTIWQNMGGTLTEPTDDASTLKFYEEVLSSETNVWNFAYQTGMLYWEKVKGYLTDNAGSLGDYGKYIEKIPQIRPNFKYYIVPGENGVDIISEGNSQITEASTAWTLTKRTGFDVTFDATLSKNNGKEMYKTLYVDFAYVLPENVKALKVESVSDAGVAVTKEITGVVPAQTAVLLMSTDVENLTKTLALSTTDGAAVANELKGNDWLINKYKINTPQLETIFALLTKLSSSLGEKYEYLKLKNSGTVNNKYFFGLSVPTEEGKFKEAFMSGYIKVLTNGEKGLGFYSNYDKNLVGNEVFMFSEDYNPILLTLKGDVNRDGSITIADVTALVNIILGKATEGDTHNYDFEAAHVNADEDITIADVTALVNIILGK